MLAERIDAVNRKDKIGNKPLKMLVFPQILNIRSTNKF